MSWSDLVKGGCSWVHAVTISGLPYVFVERNPPRVDSSSTASAPSGIDGVCEALQITDGMTASVKVERFDGVGSGDAIDIVLSFDGINEAGILSALFANPTKFFILAADIDQTTGNKAVHSLADWSSPNNEFGYIGIERVKLGLTTTVGGNKVDLQARGLAGSLASSYTHRSPTFNIIADKPTVWRGRQVTLWRNLVSPEGRIFDSAWCDTSSTYARVLWRGYVDAPPRTVGAGFSFRCLPLVRRPALPIGHSIGAATYTVHGLEDNQAVKTEAAQGLPVHVQPGLQIGTWRFQNRKGELAGQSDEVVTGNIVLKTTHPDGFFTLNQLGRTIWSATESGSTGAYFSAPILDTVAAALTGITAGSGGAGCVWPSGQASPELYLEVRCDPTTAHMPRSNYCYVTINNGAPPPFVPGLYQAAPVWVDDDVAADPDAFNVASVARYSIPLNIPKILPVGMYLPVAQTSGTEWQDVQFPASGYCEIDSNGYQQVIKWDSATSSFNNVTTPGLVMLRIAAYVSATMGFGANAEHLGPGATVEVLSGLKGDIRTVLLTLLQSSGSGNRGDFDTLPLAQGCAIHEDLINETSVAMPGLTSAQVDMFARGRTSVAELIGGHTALRRLCVVQRCTDPDATEAGASMPGDCQLAIVSTTSALLDDSSVTISAAEAVLEAIEAPESAEVPNVIGVITSGTTDQAETSITVQDLPRIMAEGPRDQQWTAPRMTEAEALQLAVSILAQGDGQVILTMRVAPWVEVQPGDPVNLTIAHPMVYDWTSSTRAPSQIGARCIGWAADLVSGMQRITLLLSGAAVGIGYLSPSVSVVNKDSATQVTIAAADAQWFTADDYCRIYNPGKEQGPKGGASPEATDIQIDSVSAASARIIFKTSLPSWVAAGTIITYPLASNTTRQNRFTHNGQSWRLG